MTRRDSIPFPFLGAPTLAVACLFAPAVEAAQTAASDPLVEIVIAEEIEDADFIREGLQAEVDRQLEIQAVAPEIDPEDPKRIRVEITGVDYQYQVTTDVERRGRFVRPAKTVNCDCTKSDLVKSALREIVACLRELDEAEREAAAASEDPREDDASKTYTPPPATDRRKITALGGVGIGLAVLGLGGIGTGVALTLTEFEDDDGLELRRRDPSIPGYAVLGAGAALVAAGVAMIVVDQVRLKRRRVAFSPQLGPSSAGLLLHGRF